MQYNEQEIESEDENGLEKDFECTAIESEIKAGTNFLENRLTATSRGFESHSLRQKILIRKNEDFLLITSSLFTCRFPLMRIFWK